MWWEGPISYYGQICSEWGSMSGVDRWLLGMPIICFICMEWSISENSLSFMFTVSSLYFRYFRIKSEEQHQECGHSCYIFHKIITSITVSSVNHLNHLVFLNKNCFLSCLYCSKIIMIQCSNLVDVQIKILFLIPISCNHRRYCPIWIFPSGILCVCVRKNERY